MFLVAFKSFILYALGLVSTDKWGQSILDARDENNDKNIWARTHGVNFKTLS